MANWTVKQVTGWLKENGFRKQTKLFQDKNIDGHALLRLTDNDISQLFFEVNEDGTIQESTIGAKSRFRIKLIEWKIDNNQNETLDESSTVVPTDSHQNKHHEEIISKKPQKKESNHVKRQGIYLIDNETQIQFFKKPKFLPYFINHIQQETIPIEIEINPIDSNKDEALFGYTLKLNGTKQENRIVRNFIKDLLNSIKTKIYEQNKVQNWLFKLKSVRIIQNVLDKESQLFTVCQLFNRRLEVSYFDNEKFHSSKNLLEMDNIIQNQIVQEDILWSAIENRHIVEFIKFNTREMLSKYQICVTEQFSKEFEDIFNQYPDDYALVSLRLYDKNRAKTRRTIEIFGYRKSVDEVLQKFQDLFVKHQLRKFRFGQISSIELDGLANLCSKELRSIEQEFRNGCVELHVQKNEFYAPQCFKDEIRHRIKNFLTIMKKKTLENIELYDNTAEKLGLNMKNLAQRNHSYCDIKLRRKIKSYPIPRGEENISKTSKFIIEQSELFCSSPLVCCQTKLANGTIEVLIGDIAEQKVDILIIPAMSFGLKESLIERAGEIIEKASLKNAIPFMTETTGGKLKCQKMLFVNWSLPTLVTNDDDLCQSIRLFISKSIEYVTTDCQQSNLKIQSIAFAVPDAWEQEEIFAEEIIEETIKQINLTKSVSLKVAFVLLSDQQILHKQFINTIRNVQKGEDSFGTFYCSTSTVTATLMSLEDDYLRKCEEKIHNYVKRSQYKMKLDGFHHWNQSMINAFYKFSIDRCVLPKTDKQQQIVLYGPINNVHEVHQKYQLTNALIQQKMNSANPFSHSYNIMFSYSQEDSIISHRLAHRLIDDGFSVWINSNPSIDFDVILSKITKSDCLILCTSRNYFRNEFCEKQAKYAEQMGKYLIPVKVEYYQPIEWLQKLIDKESYFQFFGSEQHFNFEYDKLLLKILQYTKLSSVSLVDQTSDALQQNDIGLYFLLTPEQKKFKYEKNLKKLMKLKKGRITEDDKNDLSEKIQDILQMKENYCQKYISNWFSSLHRYFRHPTSPDGQQKQDELRQIISFDIGIMSYRQWLDKLGHLKTILNIPPFTFTGDINDAVFPLLNEVLRNPNLLFSLRNHYSMSIKSDSPSEDAPVRNYSLKANRRNRTRDKSKTDERSSVVSRISNNSVKRSEKVKEFKEETKRRRVMPKKSATNGLFSKSVKMEFQSKFAEQMQKNEDDFQKFCEDNEHSAQSSPKKQKIQTYPTAIFGASPFSDIKLEPRKTSSSRNQIPLPLKFPWNGVFDTKTPSITWTNPSIFFFFEAPSSEQYSIE